MIPDVIGEHTFKDRNSFFCNMNDVIMAMVMVMVTVMVYDDDGLVSRCSCHAIPGDKMFSSVGT